MTDNPAQTENQERSMIERVARAISAAFREEGAFWDGAWENDSEHAIFLECADMVLRAMREPTEAMLVAGANSQGYLVSNRTPEDGVGIIWHAIIDKALEE